MPVAVARREKQVRSEKTGLGMSMAWQSVNPDAERECMGLAMLPLASQAGQSDLSFVL